MSKIRIEDASFHGWRGYSLTAGEVCVGVAPEIGGRIISLKHGGEDLLYVHENEAGRTYDFGNVADLRAEKRRLGFGLWGGDKTWISPQSAWWEAIPPLELDAGKYTCRIEGESVVMESPCCRETGLCITRRVALREDGSLILDETLKNVGAAPAKRGIWDVTQTLRPFDVYIPAPIKLRPYPEEGASVELFNEVVSEENGWAKITCDRAAHFKYGGVAEKGVVVALRRDKAGSLALIRAFDADPRAEYAHGSNVEIYNSPSWNYLEIEVHAPLVTLAPGASTFNRQTWRIMRFDKPVGPSEVISEAPNH